MIKKRETKKYELALFTTWFQSIHPKTQKSQYINWSERNQIIDIVETKIYISQTMVEFGPSEAKIKSKK